MQVAGGFYAEHEGRPFYPALIEFMTSGPVVVQVLEGEAAIAKNRELMGATNPEEAAEGTIRADFACLYRCQRCARVGLCRIRRARNRLLSSPPARFASALNRPFP